ncbi:MAG: hypothetical protein JST60_12120 [Chloroflexi bacterium SZAS-1]|jgi:hypothetical protein|nr:hypothetical protein [Chloroflexi bacterium SZAS-1]HNP88013.1 hypothetical protein [Kouleothrix sp.]
MSNLQPIIYIVIALLVIGVVFRVLKGIIRLALTLGILAIVAYLILRTLS